MLAILAGKTEVNQDPSLITPPLISYPPLTTGTVLKFLTSSAFEDLFWKGIIVANIHPMTETALASYTCTATISL